MWLPLEGQFVLKADLRHMRRLALFDKSVCYKGSLLQCCVVTVTFGHTVCMLHCRVGYTLHTLQAAV
jgi:hypothetical protein